MRAVFVHVEPCNMRSFGLCRDGHMLYVDCGAALVGISGSIGWNIGELWFVP